MESSRLYELKRAFEANQESPFVLEIIRKKNDSDQLIHPICYIIDYGRDKGIYISQLPKKDVSFSKTPSIFISLDQIRGFELLKEENYKEVPFAEYVKNELVKSKEGVYFAKEWRRTRLTLAHLRGEDKKVVRTFLPVGYFVGLMPFEEVTHARRYTVALTMLPKSETDLELLKKAQRRSKADLENIVRHAFGTIKIELVTSKFDKIEKDVKK